MGLSCVTRCDSPLLHDTDLTRPQPRALRNRPEDACFARLRVYVVSLSTDTSEAGLSYIDVVRKLGVYWYPVGGRGGWPKTPYNYMGFRYHGQLQSVHHVDDSVVVSDLSEAVEEVSYPSHGPVFVLTLGPAIPVPPGIRTGKKIVRSARRTVDIDLLLTSSTISEALEKMAARHADDG
jgi:hypothetical protein